MNAMLLHDEYRFMAAIGTKASAPTDLTEIQQQLCHWLQEVEHAFMPYPLHAEHPLRSMHALALQVQAIQGQWQECLQTSEQQWVALEPARQLAHVFEDRIILLVFGKFNAGKSSLCNFLASRFVAHGQPVRFFHLSGGAVVLSEQPFQEGATETTVRLQGVCLGDGLVLLDTPGLHSVTLDNAALTQRFTDSADAVLWLTSSTSPGQVQELDELARELHRHKPLQPIITRSDVIEEDEVGGALVRQWRNKEPANRRLQENDVQQRAQEKLRQMGVDASLLCEPLSLSTYMAQQQGDTEQVFYEAGWLRFYAALRCMIEPAQHYRQRKPAEVWLHHLEENVLGAIKVRMVPALSTLSDQLAQERERLLALQPLLTAAVWREVVSELPALLERYAPTGDVAAVGREVSDRLQLACGQQFREQLPDYNLDGLPLQAWSVSVPSGIGYERIPTGLVHGVAIDTCSHERLYLGLQEAVSARLTQYWQSVFEYCGREIGQLESWLIGVQDWIQRQEQILQQIKVGLRNGTPM